MGRQVAVAAGYTNLPNGYFIPELWSNKLQYKFYAATCMDKIFSHDWEGEIQGKGAKVHIRVRPDVTIGNHYVGGTLTYQDLTDSELELLIDKAKYWAFKVDDIDKKQADINYVNETTQDASEQMGIAVEQGVFSTIYAQADASNYLSADGTSSSFTTNFNTITKANILDYVVDGHVKLQEKNVPISGRWGVIPPWAAGMIMKSELKDASLAGDGTSIMRNGRLGIVARFELYESNNLYNSSSVYAPMFGTKHFCCFASQFVKTETVRLQNTFGDALRGLKVYGFKVIQDDAGVVGYWKQ